jgi:hypothetical protein
MIFATVEEHMPKQVEISIQVEVEDSLTEDEIAELVRQAVSARRGDVKSVGSLKIRTLPHVHGVSAAGYESRLWEKATC